MVLRSARRSFRRIAGPWLGILGLLTAVGCGRTEFVFSSADTDADTEGTSGDGSGRPTTGPTTGPDSGLDTGRPDDTGRPETTGPVTITDTFTSGPITDTFDSFDSGFEDTGVPGTTTGPSTTTTGPSTTGPDPTSASATETATSTDGGTTDGGTTDGGTTDGGTTDGGSTDGGTTDGGSTDGGSTGGDPTCLDAVDCVLACGVPSPGCINTCDDGLPPDENSDFLALESCIIFACIFDGSCPPGGFGNAACVACRLDGQLDPSTVGCEDEAMACAM